ncbi:MAG: hypothetical protein ACKV1O_14430 [Saprospiraceae bacterium]
MPSSAAAIEQALSELFEQWAGEAPKQVLPLAPSGSSYIYYRLEGGGQQEQKGWINE